jgi:hypothetical protein
MGIGESVSYETGSFFLKIINNDMKAFLKYEYMITPGLLKIISYIGMVLAIIAGVFTAATSDLLTGIGTAVGGPLIIRIYAELMLIIFEVHKELKKISSK